MTTLFLIMELLSHNKETNKPTQTELLPATIAGLVGDSVWITTVCLFANGVI